MSLFLSSRITTPSHWSYIFKEKKHTPWLKAHMMDYFFHTVLLSLIPMYTKYRPQDKGE